MPDSATTPCCAAILADGGDVFAQDSCLSFRPYRFSERALSQREWRGSVWARETSRGSLTGAFHVTSKQSSENTGKGATLQQSSPRGCLFVSRLRLHNEVDLLNSTAAVPSFRLDRYSESRQSVHFFERRFECALIEWVPALKLFRILSRDTIRVLRAVDT